jgi:TRAP-type transport system periplasmic protein
VITYNTAGGETVTINRRTVLKAASVIATQAAVAPFLLRAAGAAPAHSLKLGWVDSKLNPTFITVQRFAERVKTLTNGDVIIQAYGLGELGSQTNILTSLQTGLVDFCIHTTGYVDTILPRFQLLDLPYLFPSETVAEKFVDGSIGKELLGDMTQKGLVGLGFGWWGWRAILTIKKPIPLPSDIQGMKIRVQPGPIYAASFRALGANPVFVDFAEVYLTLSQGTVDGLEVPIAGLAGVKANEILKYVNLCRQVYNPSILMASQRKFEGLPPKYQEAIRTAAGEFSIDCRNAMKKAIEDTTVQLQSQGLKVSEVDNDAYKKQTRVVYDQFRDAIGADLIARAQKEIGDG